MSEMAAIPLDGVTMTSNPGTNAASLHLELQESFMQQHEMKIQMAEERLAAINHVAAMEGNEARTRSEFNAMLERERHATARYKEKREEDNEI